MVIETPIRGKDFLPALTVYFVLFQKHPFTVYCRKGCMPHIPTDINILPTAAKGIDILNESERNYMEESEGNYMAELPSG